MKVYSGKSALMQGRTVRPAGYLLLLIVLTLSLAIVPPARATPPQQKAKEAKQAKEANDKLDRDARKAMRAGKYEDALKVYLRKIEADARDNRARLGASFAYLKMQNYPPCFQQAKEVLSIDANNSRAHALAGLSLLRSGFIRAAVGELQQALDLDPKEALAYGGAAEIDYYEGRPKDARSKAYYAHNLDPQEPDYLVTYARASSRVEDFKEAADAYELFLEISPPSDAERRDRIRGLIQFYRQLAGLRVHQVGGPAVTEVPFQLGSDRRPYVRVKLNGRDSIFVIDTGSGFTVISKDAAKRFGVTEIARGGKSQGVGGSGKFQIVYGLIRSLQIGEAKVRMIPCFVRPFHGDRDRPAEERADGFIGLSVLSHFLTELDYKGARMRLDRSDNRSAPLPAVPGVTLVPFRTTQNGLISVETEFDGNPFVNAILDSGASSTVISEAAVERLNLGDQIIKGQTTSVIGAAGITENVRMLFIRNCRVADQLQSNLRALVLDFGAINETSGFEQSGILGGDFLRHFRLTIDFNRALLALQPHTPTVTKQ
ncbi:MAG TPA: aspartyl protease family protein [Blastocatellia bacterium]|nr:aspartyl protease family protein [Blastocatellia bacterium]